MSTLRGGRQGDPLSPLLFNHATRHISNELKVSWKNMGFWYHSVQQCGHKVYAHDVCRRYHTAGIKQTSTGFDDTRCPSSTSFAWPEPELE